MLYLEFLAHYRISPGKCLERFCVYENMSRKASSFKILGRRDG